jgi:O-methyltransferase
MRRKALEGVLLKSAIRQGLKVLGYEIRRAPRILERAPERIPDAELYRPLFSPWLAPSFGRYYELAARRSLVSRDRCWVLYCLGRQALGVSGGFWECGVYKGGTASMFAAMLREQGSTKKLHLFDTFEGMPETDATKDLHVKGDFSDTSLEEVRAHVDANDLAIFHPGLIPDTFAGLEAERIAFAHVDVDIYKSIIDCLEFIWPRLSPGGVVVFDDYGFPTCPGARQAVDGFFITKPEVPLCLPTGQAIVMARADKTVL